MEAAPEAAPVRKIENAVERLYQDLYEQHSILERDGERFELLLGDGFVRWKLPEGAVNHPVLLQPVELFFDAPRAEFTVAESARPVEFYTGPLRSEEVVSQTLAKVRKQVQDNPEIHPLEDVITLPFLRGLAASLDENGEFVDEPPTESIDKLRIFRSPVIFRRGRNAGFAQAVRQVLDDLADDPEGEALPNWMDGPPEGLMRFVGIETRPDNDPEPNGQTGPSPLQPPIGQPIHQAFKG